MIAGGTFVTARACPLAVISGPNDAEFCQRVSEWVGRGYIPYGNSIMTVRAGGVTVGQALVWPTVVPAERVGPGAPRGSAGSMALPLTHCRDLPGRGATRHAGLREPRAPHQSEAWWRAMGGARATRRYRGSCCTRSRWMPAAARSSGGLPIRRWQLPRSRDASHRLGSAWCHSAAPSMKKTHDPVRWTRSSLSWQSISPPLADAW